MNGHSIITYKATYYVLLQHTKTQVFQQSISAAMGNAHSTLTTSASPNVQFYATLKMYTLHHGDRSSTVVKVLCYKSEGRWFDPSRCHWNFLLT